MEKAHTESLVDRIAEPPVLPHIVFSILEPVGPQEPAGKNLEAVVALDPGLAARALSIANAHSGVEITSVQAATAVLGYRPIYAIAMSAQVFEVFVGKTDEAALRRRKWWRHSLATAAAARWLAVESQRGDPDDAYTAGLLHLLGKSLLDRYGGEDYGLVTDMESNRMDDLEAESSVYGCTHIELLRDLAINWGYPLRLVQSLDYRSAPAPGTEGLWCRSCVAVGSNLASMAASGYGFELGEFERCPAWAREVLGVTSQRLRLAMDVGIEGMQQRQLT